MRIEFGVRDRARRQTRAILRRAQQAIATEYSGQIRRLKRRSIRVHDVAAAAEALKLLSRAGAELEAMRHLSLTPDEASARLDALVSALDGGRWSLPPDQRTARAAITRAQTALLTLAAGDRPSGIGSPSPHTIVIGTELIYQARAGLFPPERMVVVAGREVADRTLLGAVYEVTGMHSPGHVRADPDRLGEALIAMEKSGCHLAGWFHSHPGRGPGSARPSAIDDRQHADWLRDFSPRLLSAIFVEDGYVHFWGSALESRSIALQWLGNGIHREGDDVHTYRLE